MCCIIYLLTRRLSAVFYLLGLPLLAFPWALSAMPWNYMWPPMTVGQYLFATLMSTNGLQLFICVGMFSDTALRRKIIYLLCCCRCCRCLHRRSAPRVVSEPPAEKDTARLVSSAHSASSNESRSSSQDSHSFHPCFLVRPLLVNLLYVCTSTCVL